MITLCLFLYVFVIQAVSASQWKEAQEYAAAAPEALDSDIVSQLHHSDQYLVWKSAQGALGSVVVCGGHQGVQPCQIVGLDLSAMSFGVGLLARRLPSGRHVGKWLEEG